MIYIESSNVGFTVCGGVCRIAQLHFGPNNKSEATRPRRRDSAGRRASSSPCPASNRLARPFVIKLRSTHRRIGPLLCWRRWRCLMHSRAARPAQPSTDFIILEFGVTFSRRVACESLARASFVLSRSASRLPAARSPPAAAAVTKNANRETKQNKVAGSNTSLRILVSFFFFVPPSRRSHHHPVCRE